MKYIIFHLFFGTDELITHIGQLLRVRAALLKTHASNKQLAAALTAGQQTEATLATEHAWAKLALTNAFDVLELN